MKQFFQATTFLCFLIFSTSSCAVYERYPLPKSRVMRIDKENLAFYLVDAAHPLSRVWYLSECRLNEQEISCFMTRMTETEAKEVAKITSKRDSRWSKSDVLFYADPKYAVSLGDTCTKTIPLDRFEKIEVYELNHLKTFGTPLLSFTGLTFLLFLFSEG